MEKRSFRDGVQFAWDATSLELAQTCLRKYYYTMIRGIQPRQQNVHLLFGGLYASALEGYYKHKAAGASHEDAMRSVVHTALINSWVRDESPAGGYPMTFDHAAKTRPNLIRTIVWYLEQYGEETEDGLTTYHLADGTPAVELSFNLELSEDILYCGHLDRVSDFGGKLYVVDQKTTGSTIGPYFFDQFNPSNQMTGYAWAGKVILKSPVHGVIIDAAQIAINFTEFGRGVTTRTESQIAEWHESALWTINLARHATEMEKFPMNASSCGNYGGCPFRRVCSRPQHVRENFIKADYTEHNWDPLEAR